jgi:hypothetical protein
MEPYDSIRPVPARGFQWLTEAKKATLKRLYDETKARIGHDLVVLEVGSWFGDSARWFGALGAKRIYCVDTWAGPVQDAVMHFVPNLYQQFLSNIMATPGLQERVVPLRMASLEAAFAFGSECHLIYIDGDHSTLGAYNDVMAWRRHLVPGGVICGDDWEWSTVQDGVKQAIGKPLRAEGDTWWCEP